MEVDVVNAILAQNKLLSQQMSLITQQLSSLQSPVAKFHSAPPDVPYDMSGSSSQSETYNYDQYIPEQVNYMGSSPRNPNDAPFSQNFNQG